MPVIKDLNFVKEGFEYNERAKELCILIHGYGSFLPWKWNTQNKLKDLKQIIEAELSSESNDNHVDIYFPKLNKETSCFSTHNPNDIVSLILKDIDKIWQNKTYENIYLIGYSMGALLARKVYVCACGNNPEAPLEKEFNDFQSERKWAEKVNRIILLAGINRGWSINYHLSFWKAISWTIGAGLGNLIMLCGPKPLVFNIRKGASFITQLRIQWIYMRGKAEEKSVGQALTIQLLGTKDDLVSPEDNIDLVSGKDFVYLEVPFSNHFNVVEMAIPPTTKDENEYDECEKRGVVFLSALTNEAQALKNQSQKLTSGVEELTFTHKRSRKKPSQITDVIFVIHGIRDEGHWTNRIAQRVLKENETANEHFPEENQRHFAIETSRYGYFPMLLFALPWTRRAKVAWFMDQYAENLALYPKADFSFIGHSNGTYLLAQAIKEYECCKFKRIVFAGSVVPKDYDWPKYIDLDRAKEVLNYVATRDWVVAIFPNFLYWFQRDLGSAGHDGFKFLDSDSDIKYVTGGHGAALNELNWDSIAKFIVNGEPEQPPNVIFKQERDSCAAIFVEFLGKIAPLIWLLILLGLGVLGHAILFKLELAEWLKTSIFIGYIWVIYQILTKI